MNMQTQNISATIVPRVQKQEFTYENVLVLTVENHYFTVRLAGGGPVETAINSRIQMQVDDLNTYASTTLYENAVETYQYSKEEGFPFNAFEAGLYYSVTFNQDCFLSMYRDQFEYTGGAHPNTLRYSDTWNLRTGMLVPLSSFFAPGSNYQQLILGLILAQADKNQAENPVYFEDYRKLIVQQFNPQSFFLSPCGLVIYYQQYDIAPYYVGIVEFTIPYKFLKNPPSCSL
jgi:hypothetical protein